MSRMAGGLRKVIRGGGGGGGGGGGCEEAGEKNPRLPYKGFNLGHSK